MPGMTDRYFPLKDLERISAAVREAESKTSGEIVPFFVEHSDAYEEAVWRAAGLAGFFVLGTFALVRLFTDVWFSWTPVEMALFTLGASGLAGLAALYIPAIKRFFAGQDLIDHRVALRAADAFIAEEVFKTRDRTGILIFLSLQEHKVLVVGDTGINARVDRSEWEDVVARIVNGINTGKPADGLIEAIHACGRLLEKHKFKRRKNDRNELSNELRVVRRRKPRAKR